MKRRILAIALRFAGVMLFGVGAAQDRSPAQIARVEGAQSPNRQGFGPYTIPEMIKQLHGRGRTWCVW